MWCCTPAWLWIWCVCAGDNITCRRVPFSSTTCCIRWPGGTWTGIGIGGEPLCDTIGTVTGPVRGKRRNRGEHKSTLVYFPCDEASHLFICAIAVFLHFNHFPRNPDSAVVIMIVRWSLTREITSSVVVVVVLENSINWDLFPGWRTDRRIAPTLLDNNNNNNNPRRRRAIDH